MKLKHLLNETIGNVEIKYISAEEDYDEEIWNQAYKIAEESGIRISSNKELKIIAIDDNYQVHGAVWADYNRNEDLMKEHESEEEIYAYDFDVAVKKESRALGATSPKIGIKLIDAAIRDYKYTSHEFGHKDCIYVWVVNPKLAKWLEEKRGFEPYSMSRNGTGRMIYYGK